MFQHRFTRSAQRPDQPHQFSQSDCGLLLQETAALLPSPARRLFLRGAVGLGTLAMLTGCEVVDSSSAEDALKYVSRFNDRVQAMLFNPRTLAPTFAASEITRPFPFNAFYEQEKAPVIEEADYTLDIAGLVTDTKSWTLAELAKLPQESQITRHICIEGWSAIGHWTGVPFHVFLDRIGADKNAAYVEFQCADDYSTSIDMATALHPQTQLTLGFDGGPLPRIYGYPMKLRVPTKLGFKNPKHIISIEVTNEYRDGFWEAYGYNWHSGL